MIGLKRYTSFLDVAIFFHSFVTSFIASLIGCSIPFSEALFGPLRLWLMAISFRSASVKKATLSRTETVIISDSIIVLV